MRPLLSSSCAQVLLALGTNWGDTGSVDQYAGWCRASHEDFFSSSACIQLYKDHIDVVTSRVNTVNGRRWGHRTGRQVASAQSGSAGLPGCHSCDEAPESLTLAWPCVLRPVDRPRPAELQCSPGLAQLIPALTARSCQQVLRGPHNLRLVRHAPCACCSGQLQGPCLSTAPWDHPQTWPAGCHSLARPCADGQRHHLVSSQAMHPDSFQPAAAQRRHVRACASSGGRPASQLQLHALAASTGHFRVLADTLCACAGT